jgi:Tfp pilus assembly protein PilN
LEKPSIPVAAIVIMIVLGLSSAFGHQLRGQAQEIIAKLAQQHNAVLVNGNNPQRHDRAKDQKRLAELITELRNQKRVQTATDAGGAKARGVWLKSIRNQGETLAIEGMATSTNAMAQIISDLRSTGYFKDIEIKETYQDDSKNKTHAFRFQLTCEFEIEQVLKGANSPARRSEF